MTRIAAPLRRLARALAAFRREENGSITVETMIVLPAFIWLFLATFVFFDAFNMQSKNIKAGYTIGDVLSRETGYVTSGYINGLNTLQGSLLRSDNPRALQITIYSYDTTTRRYRVRWSRGTGGLPALTDAALAQYTAQLPVMPAGEVAILTRSRVDYRPLFDVGLTAFTFDEISITRPRFAPQICWNTSATAPASTAVC